LFPKDNAITNSIIHGWQYQPYMFEFFNVNMIDTLGKNIIDIGANNGNFAIDFAHMVGDEGKVFAFEPQRIIYYQLCGNVFMNGIDNIYCHNVALGDTSRTTFIDVPNYYSKDHVNFGDVSITHSLKSSEKYSAVPCNTLDSYEFENVVLIKIDVQGYEPYVLDGASDTIHRNRPYIIIEAEDDQLAKFGFSTEIIVNKLAALDYKVEKFNNSNDFIAIPKEKMDNFTYKIP
jgi:FkbM family methyltransferase